MTDNIAAPHLENQARPMPATPMRNLPVANRSRADRIALIGLFSLGVLYTLHFARELLLPVFLALLLSLLLRPLVKALRRVGVPEMAGAALVVSVVLVTLGFSAYQLSGPAATWIQRGPVVMRQLETKLGDIRKAIDEARKASQQIESLATEKDDATPVVVQGPSLAEQVLTQTQVVFAQAFIILVLLFFFLAQGRQMLERLIGTMSNLEQRIHYATLANSVQRNIAAYLATVTVINIGLGLATAGTMMLFGLPNPGLWGVLAGVLNFIPVLGHTVTFLIIAIVSALTFNEVPSIVLPPLAFLALAAVEGNVITPMIVGRRLTLNPIAVFLSILFWGWLWSIPGALMAVPILAVFKIYCDAHKPLHPIGALLGG
jgi:predicted PurR-regulated permease PerM